MTKTETRRLSSSQLANLDAYIALRITEVESIGVDATPLYDLLAQVRRAWSSTDEGHEAARRHYLNVSRDARGRAALETAVYDLAVSARKPRLWTAA